MGAVLKVGVQRQAPQRALEALALGLEIQPQRGPQGRERTDEALLPHLYAALHHAVDGDLRRKPSVAIGSGRVFIELCQRAAFEAQLLPIGGSHFDGHLDAALALEHALRRPLPGALRLWRRARFRAARAQDRQRAIQDRTPPPDPLTTPPKAHTHDPTFRFELTIQ